MEQLPKIAHHTDWVTFLFALSLGLLLLARTSAPVRFRQFVGLPFSPKRMELMQNFQPLREFKRFEVMSSILSYLMLAFAIFLLRTRFNKGMEASLHDYANYAGLLIAISLYFLLRTSINALLDWVYRHEGQLYLHSSIALSYRVWMGLALLPILVISTFMPYGIAAHSWILLLFTAAGLLWSMLQSNVILWQMRVPAYYKFLYICALEIIPLIWLIQWMFF